MRGRKREPWSWYEIGQRVTRAFFVLVLIAAVVLLVVYSRR
jgi:hypothetical protein